MKVTLFAVFIRLQQHGALFSKTAETQILTGMQLQRGQLRVSRCLPQSSIRRVTNYQRSPRYNQSNSKCLLFEDWMTRRQSLRKQEQC